MLWANSDYQALATMCTQSQGRTGFLSFFAPILMLQDPLGGNTWINWARSEWTAVDFWDPAPFSHFLHPTRLMPNWLIAERYPWRELPRFTGCIRCLPPRTRDSSTSSSYPAIPFLSERDPIRRSRNACSPCSLFGKGDLTSPVSSSHSSSHEMRCV